MIISSWCFSLKLSLFEKFDPNFELSPFDLKFCISSKLPSLLLLLLLFLNVTILIDYIFANNTPVILARSF